MKILVDTNVVMDALEGTGKFYETSYRTMEICARELATGYLAAHTITNLFYDCKSSISVPIRTWKMV